jgi:hypothetical protein
MPISGDLAALDLFERGECCLLHQARLARADVIACFWRKCAVSDVSGL